MRLQVYREYRTSDNLNMNTLTAFILVVAFGCCAAQNTECGKRTAFKDLPYIVGGREAKANSWPWQLSLQNGNFHYCGAVLLSDKWAVTAGHCVDTKPTVTVVAGEHDRSRVSGDEVRTTGQVFVNEAFINSSPWPNDIALIKLAQPLTLNAKIFPACFPQTEDFDVDFSNDCYISGWGDTKGTGDNTVLNELNIPPIPNALCQLSWGASILETNICIGDGTSGSCQGDSGGPLVCKKGESWFLAGVTSWGIRGCRTEGYPAVYTRTALYKRWVDSTIAANGGY